MKQGYTAERLKQRNEELLSLLRRDVDPRVIAQRLGISATQVHKLRRKFLANGPIEMVGVFEPSERRIYAVGAVLRRRREKKTAEEQLQSVEIHMVSVSGMRAARAYESRTNTYLNDPVSA